MGISAAVLGLALGAILWVPAEPHASEQPPPGSAAGIARSVTLVTGDRVLLLDGKVRSVTPGPGRDGMSFQIITAGRQYVIPADAGRLVAAGRVDRRLFDITTLLEFGYAGAQPLIVTGQGARATMRSAVTRELPAVNGIAVEAGTQGDVWRALTGARAGVEKIWLDGKRRAVLDRSVRQIGAPAAWEAGLTGAGVTIAVLDTGVDETHPDLAGRQIAEQNFSDAADAVDHAGHGTHVASIAAGTGAKSGGRYRGVASGVSIMDGKVLDDRGFGSDSDIIAGMQWAVAQGADIVNMSLGGDDEPELDPVEEAVNTLSAEHGTLFVVAAGNSGPDDKSVGSPGSADAALTVGAVDRNDSLWGFSSRGPRAGDGAIKPDVTAPGVGIVAALHADGTIKPPVEPGYTDLSGTSMATPHVAGAAALLAQQHPDWTGARLKAALSASATPKAGLTAFQQGAGRVDVATAITQTIVTEPANVSMGTAAWPHHDDEPVSKPLTYRNLGTTDVTLSLAADVRGPNGAPAPDGMFSLSANEITVPAGGTAQVTVTGDTRMGTADGHFTGAIVATAGDTTARTPLAVDREVESYQLNLNHLGDNGALTSRYVLIVRDRADGVLRFPYDEDGSVTLRLPKGRYLVDANVITTKSGADHFNLIRQPDLMLDRDTTVDLDARTAKPVSVTPPAPARLENYSIGYDLAREFSVTFSTREPDLRLVSTAHLGPPVRDFVSLVNTQWTGQDGAYYGLAWSQPGVFPTGFAKTVKRRELAMVNAEFGSVTPNRLGWRLVSPFPAAGGVASTDIALPVSLPGKRTEYVTTDGVRWISELMQVTEDTETIEAVLFSPLRAYRAGKTYAESVNHAVFGPALPNHDYLGNGVSRSGDSIVVGTTALALFGDGAGNLGFSALESMVVRLYRGDTLVGEVKNPVGDSVFPVPPDEADYRLTIETTRPDIFDVSTAVDVEWTFRSGHTGEPLPLPVSALRYLPTVDSANSAPAGVPYLVPVQLLRTGGTVTRPRQLNVEVSYDEGATWRRAEVGHNMVVKLTHPADATSVSLRASATDRDGKTVKQTIIRAYKLRA